MHRYQIDPGFVLSMSSEQKEMRQVIISCYPSGLEEIKELGLEYVITKDGSIVVSVKEVPYDETSYIVDHNDQICDHYDINPDVVYDVSFD